MTAKVNNKTTINIRKNNQLGGGVKFLKIYKTKIMFNVLPASCCQYQDQPQVVPTGDRRFPFRSLPGFL